MSILAVNTVSVEGAPLVNCFRLIHNSAEVVNLFESDGVTRTRLPYFAATTKTECLSEIARLKLKCTTDRFMT
jgi:hypothetical protein